MRDLNRLIGLSGVAPNENRSAVLWGRYFSMLLIGAVLWLIFQWQLELNNNLSVYDAWFANFIVWSLFVTETAVLTLLVRNRKHYLKTNWLNIVIIVAGIPLLIWELGPIVTLLRVLRVLLIVGLIVPWFSLCLRFLTDSRLDTTILAAFIILVFAGTLIAGIDPAITSIEDGIWWAWVTVSTVGYGDMVPTTRSGRLFGGLLILVGMALFSIITANFAALFVQKNAKKNKYINRKWEQNFNMLNKLNEKELTVLRQLKSFKQNLQHMEHRLDDLTRLHFEHPLNQGDPHGAKHQRQCDD